MKILINGIDRTSLYRHGTLSIRDAVSRRSTASFSLVSKGGKYHPSSGEPVEIYDASNILIFAGLIDMPRETSPVGSDTVTIPIEAVDNQAIADRRLVIQSYDNQTAGAIVNDILSSVLANEGIIAGTIKTGPTVKRAVFPYVKASKALDDLSELAGFSWWITHDKKLHFADRATFKASWNITDTSQPISNVDIEQNRNKYRNRQYIRAGKDISDLVSESFKGDGSQQTYTVGLEIAKEPTIYINGTQVLSSDVGIRGVESGKKWYWSKGEKEITQEETATPLSSTDVLKIDYYGFFPIIVVSERGDAISSRQKQEGGTGLYETVEEFSGLDDAEAALDIADGKLRRYGRFNKVITFDTFKSGLSAGALMTIEMTLHGISNQKFLIENIDIRDIGGKIKYIVKVVDGEAVGGWEQFFKSLTQTGGTVSLRENEILVKLKTARDTVSSKDSLTIEKSAPESRIGYARIGFSEIA